MRICIKNGTVFSPSNNINDKRDVYIDKGKIISLKKKPNGFKSDLDINAKDKIILPGLVDICGRLGEIGSEKNIAIKNLMVLILIVKNVKKEIFFLQSKETMLMEIFISKMQLIVAQK